MISKYHSPLREAKPIREMSDSGDEVGEVQVESGTSFYVRK